MTEKINNCKKFDGLILAGGKSRRMGGSHKGDLIYHKESFQERIIHELQKEAKQVWISWGADVRREYPGCKAVQDEYPECGAMGGLHAGLKQSRNPLVMVAACDMPFLNIEVYRYLYERLMEADLFCDGAVPVTDGRIHPLAAIYGKQMADCFEMQIKKGDYRLRDALRCRNILYVDLDSRPDLGRMLMNINTIQEYETIVKQAEEAKKGRTCRKLP